jgi:hypothetical protein
MERADTRAVSADEDGVSDDGVSEGTHYHADQDQEMDGRCKDLHHCHAQDASGRKDQCQGKCIHIGVWAWNSCRKLGLDCLKNGNHAYCEHAWGPCASSLPPSNADQVEANNDQERHVKVWGDGFREAAGVGPERVSQHGPAPTHQCQKDKDVVPVTTNGRSTCELKGLVPAED